MGGEGEYKPGKSSLSHGVAAQLAPSVTPGKSTLTQSPSGAKSEGKGGSTGKVDGIVAPPGPRVAHIQAAQTGRAEAAKHEDKDDKAHGAEKKEVKTDAGGSPKHVVPSFVLSESEGARSNSDPATTNTDDPTFTGSVVKDGAVWRYQLDSVESKGRISLVYYTADHYPAPTPNDDTGALSNVNSGNWKDVVKELKDHRTIVAGKFSSYRRTQLHERYHWEHEWQGEVKKALVTAETEIAKLSSNAATDSAAKAELEPRAKTIFADQMRAARTAYNALPDTPGSAPYIAGAAGVDALVARVEAEAASKHW